MQKQLNSKSSNTPQSPDKIKFIYPFRIFRLHFTKILFSIKSNIGRMTFFAKYFLVGRSHGRVYKTIDIIITLGPTTTQQR